MFRERSRRAERLRPYYPLACGEGPADLARHLRAALSSESFEKLTAGGMTFLDTKLMRVLDEVLPARFGGGPTDYQLLEYEGDDGASCVRLLVHPKIGPLNASALADAFLTALGQESGAERAMEVDWCTAQLLRIERRPPFATSTGKILHLRRSPQTASKAAIGR
jgi:hypothetical protein